MDIPIWINLLYISISFIFLFLLIYIFILLIKSLKIYQEEQIIVSKRIKITKIKPLLFRYI